MSNQQQIQQATQACFDRAQELYGVDLSNVKIMFNLKGAAMGQARWRFNRSTGEVWDLQLRYNLRMCSEDMHDAIHDTVPHEVAHIVCAVNPKLGNNHDAGWQRVCIALGGTGKRTHEQEVIYAKGNTYAYTATCGTVVNLSEQRHKKLQRGAQLRLKTGGTITRTNDFQIVGRSGRRVSAPQPQQVAAKKPTTPVEQPKKVKKMTKADQVRAAIKRVKEQGLAEDAGRTAAVEYAQAELDMKPAMARRYVQENWAKV